MEKTRDQAIEETKKLVMNNFFPELCAVRPMFGMQQKITENIYEAKTPKELRKRVVEFEGTYLGYGEEKDTISIMAKERIYVIMPIAETAYSDSIIESEDPITYGDGLHIIAVQVEGYPVYIAVTIIRNTEMWIFEQISSAYGKAHAIRDYYKFFEDSPGKKTYILNQLRGERYKRYDSGEDILFESSSEQILKYAICKETYAGETQREIEAMFRDPNALKHKTEQKLSYLAKIVPAYKKRATLKKEELEDLLNKRFYKMESAKAQLVDFLVSNEQAKKRGFNILLVGGAGVGKTSLMETIADAYHIPSEIIPLNGLSTTLELEGCDSGYDNADAGRIIKAFAGHGTSEMVIGLDEMDKMNSFSHEGDPMTVLYRLLLGKHEDKFLGCPVSTENTIFIATANSIDAIPEAILNRFHAVIRIEDYSVEDKIEIAKKHVIPAILDNFRLGAGTIRFSDETLRRMVIDYSEDGGVRDLHHNLERVIRHKIASGQNIRGIVISTEEVREILEPLIEVTPAILFNRNREDYPKEVAKAIQKLICETKRRTRSETGQAEVEKKHQKLDYLLACRNESGMFEESFDLVKFSEYLHKHLYGMEKVIKEAAMFYHTALLQGRGLNTNLALCGGFGVGKTTIVKNIAEAMGYHFVKISLNGVDEAKVLRGFSSTYIGSEPGRIIKGVKEAGSLRTVFQLDEIDKLKPEMANVLLDLLDRDFTDNFLDVPVDFRQAIFVATANEWGNVPAVVRDRFIVVEVDGYTRAEKKEIVSNYIIPRIERAYERGRISVEMEPGVENYLLETYCTSFGVRDAEKAVQRIVANKLVEQCGRIDAEVIRIGKEDIRKYIGEEPIPRGNFTVNGNVIPGISKALAVNNGNQGSTFAIETVLLEGTEGLELTGLPRETASDSVKIAITCMKKMFPGILKKQHIHVHFGEGAVPKDGPSAGVALFMSILSAALNEPFMDKAPYDIAYTGEISLTGGIFAVGGVMEKIQAACDSGCRKVFIPAQNYAVMNREKLIQFGCDVIPVSNVREVIEQVFPKERDVFGIRAR